MSFVKEFKEFATRGNVVDLAVGVIIGAAFGKIITSFVNDIIMPPIGLITNGVDFSKAKYVLKEAVERDKCFAEETRSRTCTAAATRPAIKRRRIADPNKGFACKGPAIVTAAKLR